MQTIGSKYMYIERTLSRQIASARPIHGLHLSKVKAEQVKKAPEYVGRQQQMKT